MKAHTTISKLLIILLSLAIPAYLPAGTMDITAYVSLTDGGEFQLSYNSDAYEIGAGDDVTLTYLMKGNHTMQLYNTSPLTRDFYFPLLLQSLDPGTPFTISNQTWQVIDLFSTPIPNNFAYPTGPTSVPKIQDGEFMGSDSYSSWYVHVGDHAHLGLKGMTTSFHVDDNHGAPKAYVPTWDNAKNSERFFRFEYTVPDTGSTLAMMGAAFLGLGLIRRKFSA